MRASYKLYRRAGSPFWQAEYSDGEQRWRESTGFADKEQASRFAAQRAAAASDPAPDQAEVDRQAHTLSESLQRLLQVGVQEVSSATVHCYRHKAGHLARLLGQFDVNSLNLDTLQDYCTIRTEEGAAPESVRKELVTLRRALTLSFRRRFMIRDPAEIMPKFRVRYVPVDRWLSQAEFERLIAHLAAPRRLWVITAVYTGCRRSELEGLTWQDIDWKRGIIRVRGTKTKGSHRIVPLHPRLAAELQPVERQLGIILQPWDNAIRDLQVACKNLQIRRCTPNDFRRTFASWLKQAGQDSFVVAQLLGHTSSRMVELVYGRLDHSTLAAAVSKLPTT
jgi:site-specific recombinase XerD